MGNNLTNTNSLITLDEIYLWRLYNKQLGHECMHLQTDHVITGYNMKDAPVTDLFIKSVKYLTA